MDLAKIKAIREANRVAMERENAEKAEAKAREIRAQELAEIEAPAMMVAIVDLVLGCPGRPLSSATVARLREIRNRNSR